MIMPDEIDLKTCGTAMLNPLSVLGLIDVIKKCDTNKCVIQTGASSHVSYMFNKLC